MRGTAHVPQPWQSEGMTQRDFMAWSDGQERDGARLAIQYLVNGYQAMDGDWSAERIVLTDWRTHKMLCSLSANDNEDDYGIDNVLIVERIVIE